MRLLVLTVIGALAGVAALSTASEAATISGNYSFSASNFTSGSPISPVTGTVAITFDNTQTYSNAISGVSLVSSNITLGSALQFTYLSGPDILVLGGAASTVSVSDPSSGDFALFIQNATSSARAVTSFTYSAGAGATFTAATNSVSFTAAAVPEPISMSLLGTAVIGFIGYRRMKSS